MKRIISTLAVMTLSWQAMATTTLNGNVLSDYAKYKKAVQKVSTMDRDPKVRELVKDHGLSIVDVTWEDTGRAQNSSLGPNISDMTIQAHVIGENGDIEPVAMPVIRYPNFNDKTADLSPSKFNLLVGNEKGDSLEKITLTEYLDNFRNYLSLPESWAGQETSLLAARDTHVLVSSQVAMLPVPQGGTAHFNPVLFNYQSSKENPAVLSIIATREGTSATIIDNDRDTFKNGWGQRLFFNTNGEKASFTAQRAKDLIDAGVSPEVDANNIVTANKSKGMNMVLLIQVPLKHKTTHRFFPMYAFGLEKALATSIDDAVIGHGPVEGNFVEIDDLAIERDERFPIRVTVQFYKAVDQANLSKQEVLSFRKQIDEVYQNTDYVGSLVTEGITGRPTEHNVPFICPTWWYRIWPIFYGEYGITENEAMQALHKTYGDDWVRMTASEEKFRKALAIATNTPIVE